VRNVTTIAGRELHSYFSSPIFYVVTALFLAISGYFFSLILFFTREASLEILFANLGVILLLISPALTMRLLAEEERSGTIELLLTSPVRDWEVIAGKYLASLALFAIMLLLTLDFPLILERFGQPDRGPMLTGYLGIFLVGAAYLSIGVLTSAMTQNQVVAAMTAFALLLILWLADTAAGLTGGALSSVLSYVSLARHFPDFTQGVIDTSHIVYYLSVILAALFLATRVLETRRWR